MKIDHYGSTIKFITKKNRNCVKQSADNKIIGEKKIRTPAGVLGKTRKSYTGALPGKAVFLSTEVRTFPMSSDGHTSIAPADSAAIHSSSSGTRWVQTIGSSGKSR